MVLPARRHLSDHMPKRPPEVIELRTGDEPVVVEVAKGSVQVRAGAVRTPNAVVTGSPRLVLAVLKGDIDLAQARSKGLQYKGDPQTLRRVQPLAVKRRVPGAGALPNNWLARTDGREGMRRISSHIPHPREIGEDIRPRGISVKWQAVAN